MTVRELYRNVLIELNKEEASALYVEDFLYFANKAVNIYVNRRYNIYDTSQQLGDDLRVLRVPVESITQEIDNLKNLDYTYRHLLNCKISVKLHRRTFGCEQLPDTVAEYPAKRMTADRKMAIMNNEFLKPEFYRPYYDISGNTLTVMTGKENEEYTVEDVQIEYLRDPEVLNMTADDLQDVVDTTDELEFPEYVNMEILNILVGLILEQQGNPRLGSNIQMGQSIVQPGGQAPQK